MPEIARPIVTLQDFDGLIVNVDPINLPDGAGEEQNNCVCVKYGELVVRRGIRQVSFDQ